MKKLLISLALLGLATAPSYASMSTSGAGFGTASTVFAQEDCKEGEKWNEDAQKCEAESG